MHSCIFTGDNELNSYVSYVLTLIKAYFKITCDFGNKILIEVKFLNFLELVFKKKNLGT